jgi:hypothetical protein
LQIGQVEVDTVVTTGYLDKAVSFYICLALRAQLPYFTAGIWSPPAILLSVRDCTTTITHTIVLGFIITSTTTYIPTVTPSIAVVCIANPEVL